MFNKRPYVVVAAVLLLSCLAPAAQASQAISPPPPPQVSMQAGLLMELESGNVLWAREESSLRAPASLTKVLTALVALENSPLEKTGVISPAARNVPGQRMFAEEGWTMTVGDMLWGLLLQSGNDAAISLAETVSPDGTQAGFMKMANDRARELGATDTNFVNPHGMDQPGHQTTARDLALITAAALQDPTFKQMVSSKTHVVPWGDGQKHLFINHNKLLWRYPGAMGVKTGFTRGAGSCLISAVQRDGHTLIAVVMGSPNHYAESTALYDWGFGNLASLKTASKYSIRPDLTPASAELTIDGETSDTGIASGGVQLRLLIPMLGIVFLGALAMVRRYSLYFSRT
ncbi:MAG TPA: D-alanyl-D-alanine carboxypeptidase family protein [Actinomycetota bacterium]|nr:D-alanyl-D-alanine carboxypeptidase family protein [Actinomycetota bacterium]